MLAFKTGLDNYMSVTSLSSVSVTPASGWQQRPYQTADGEAITSTPFDPEAPAGHTTQDLLRHFATTAKGQDHAMATTFQRGDDLIALSMRFVPHTPRKKTMAERFGGAPPPVDEPPAPRTVIATVYGVPFVEQPREESVPGQDTTNPVNYRHFLASVGNFREAQAVKIIVLTNTGDAGVVGVLSRLDVLDINSRIDTPSADINEAAGVFTRDPMPLSEQPPRPTVAYRAAQLLASNATFEAPWQEVLEKIRAGEIETWEAMHAAYPKVADMPPALLDVLDDGSADNAARYHAAVLANGDREWTDHEAHVLATMSKPGAAQADLTEYLDGTREIAPELVSLIQQLPMVAMPDGSSDAVVADETPGLRDAHAGCTIENGVRRCVVDTN
ncbi:hypothetical protein ACJ5NV_03070 [Loktanella agnita]|uniref:hypothetical protein n=1 Tax=Loktanella agnita TaxID=287097 RepID=UPI0039888046